MKLVTVPIIKPSQGLLSDFGSGSDTVLFSGSFCCSNSVCQQIQVYLINLNIFNWSLFGANFDCCGKLWWQVIQGVSYKRSKDLLKLFFFHSCIHVSMSLSKYGQESSLEMENNLNWVFIGLFLFDFIGGCIIGYFTNSELQNLLPNFFSLISKVVQCVCGLT